MGSIKQILSCRMRPQGLQFLTVLRGINLLQNTVLNLNQIHVYLDFEQLLYRSFRPVLYTCLKVY